MISSRSNGVVGDVWVRKPKSGAAQYYLVIGSVFDFEQWDDPGDDGTSYCLGTVKCVPLLDLETGKTTSVRLDYMVKYYGGWQGPSIWELFCSSSNHDQLKIE